MPTTPSIHSHGRDACSAGFTLVELLIAMAVASVLLGVAVPSFTNAIQNSRISAQYNQVARAFFLARSESVKSGEFVVVCPRKTPTAMQCGGKNKWKNGWLVFVDTDSEISAAAKVESDDTIIAVEPAFVGDNTIEAHARLSNGGKAKKVAYVRFRPAGDSNWSGGSIVICDKKRGSEYSKAANVRITGDIQRGRPNGSSLIPLDVFNTPVDCGSGT